MARAKGSVDRSRLRAMETMDLLLEQDSADRVPELPREWRDKLAAQPGRCASGPRQAALATIAAGLAPSRARASPKAQGDLADALAKRYAAWINDPVERERQRAMVPYRWAKKSFAPDAYDGWSFGFGPEGVPPPPEPWRYFVPRGVPVALWESIGKMLLHVARNASFPTFFDAWLAVGALANSHSRRNET